MTEAIRTPGDLRVALALGVSLLLHALLMLPIQYGQLSGDMSRTGVAQRPPFSGSSARTQLAAHPLQVRLPPATSDADNAELRVALLDEPVEPLQSTTSPRNVVVALHDTPTTAVQRVDGVGQDLGIALSALRYYDLPELDQRPLLKIAPALDEAPTRSEVAVNGLAILELLIERNGEVNAVNVLKNTLPPSYLAPLRQAFSRIAYTPGRKTDRDVRSRIYIEVIYVDGVINNLPLPAVDIGTFPTAPDPHKPIELAPDRYQRKQNPPLQRR